MYETRIDLLQKKISERVIELRKRQGIGNPNALTTKIESDKNAYQFSKARKHNTIYQAMLRIEDPENHMLDSKEWLPPILDLLVISNVLHCDINYLLGKYSEPTMEETDIHDYTGLSPAAIDALHTDYVKRIEMAELMHKAVLKSLKSNNADSSDEVVDSFVADPSSRPFLEFLIQAYMGKGIKLFGLVNEERLMQNDIKRLHSSKKYQKLHSAFIDALHEAEYGIDDPSRLLFSISSEEEYIQECFSDSLLKAFSKQYKSLQELDDWLIKEFEMSSRGVCSTLIYEYEQTNRRRIISDEFMMLVNTYVNGGEE